MNPSTLMARTKLMMWAAILALYPNCPEAVCHTEDVDDSATAESLSTRTYPAECASAKPGCATVDAYRTSTLPSINAVEGSLTPRRLDVNKNETTVLRRFKRARTSSDPRTPPRAQLGDLELFDILSLMLEEWT